MHRMYSVRRAACPNCGHAVELPQRFMVSAWRRLACPACHTRLEVSPPLRASLLLPLSFLPLIFFLLVRFVGPYMQLFLMGLMLGIWVSVVIALAIVWRWESRHPALRVRTRKKAEIALNLSLRT